jgi:hypothetical protein
MAGNLAAAIITLLAGALPDLLGGPTPPVALAVAGDIFDVDPDSADATAGAPRPDDRVDTFAFDPATPAGPYTLAQPPYPGPRRVWLTTEAGDRFALRADEVVWDKVDSRILHLQLRLTRSLTGITGLRVLYGVTAIFTKLKGIETLTISLQSGEAAQLLEAEALAIAVLQLNREQLISQAAASYSGGDYGAAVDVKSLALLSGGRPADDIRLLTLKAAFELKATRALADDEGIPIRRILTPGRTTPPDRPVDIVIDVDV